MINKLKEMGASLVGGLDSAAKNRIFIEAVRIVVLTMVFLAGMAMNAGEWLAAGAAGFIGGFTFSFAYGLLGLLDE